MWGGDRKGWPQNWRQLMAEYLGSKDHPRTLNKACPATCPLHPSPELHQHFVLNSKTLLDTQNREELFLGALEQFGYQDENGVRAYDWSGATAADEADRQAIQEQIDADRKAGRLVAVYLPVLLFGPSPRSGLSYEQRQLLLALTHELTRVNLSNRPDKAKIVVGGKDPDPVNPSPVAACPYLTKGESYVDFTGNGGGSTRRLHSRGYHLIGETKKGWLRKAGSAIPANNEGRWQAVKAFLTDLKTLSGAFGLIAAGWHSDQQKCHSLDEMIALVSSVAGRQWLDKCLRRVYTKTDYLTHWRRYFAERLVFTVLVSWDEDASVEHLDEKQVTIHSANDLQCWMHKIGWSDEDLAVKLGMARSWVNMQRTGKRKWSAKFAVKVQGLIDQTASGEPAPNGEKK